MSHRLGRRRRLDVLGLTCRQQELVAYVVFGCFAALVLICGGLMTTPSDQPRSTYSISGRIGEHAEYATSSISVPFGTRHELSGTVTWIGTEGRSSLIALRHNGCDGLIAGGHKFYRWHKRDEYPPPLPVNLEVGEEVVLTIESQFGDWFVREVKRQR